MLPFQVKEASFEDDDWFIQVRWLIRLFVSEFTSKFSQNPRKYRLSFIFLFICFVKFISVSLLQYYFVYYLVYELITQDLIFHFSVFRLPSIFLWITCAIIHFRDEVHWFSFNSFSWVMHWLINLTRFVLSDYVLSL